MRGLTLEPVPHAPQMTPQERTSPWEKALTSATEERAAEVADLLEELVPETEAVHDFAVLCDEAGTRFALEWVQAGANVADIGHIADLAHAASRRMRPGR